MRDTRIARVLVDHVGALDVGHHLEGELVMVAEEDAPLTALRDLGRAFDDLDERLAILETHRHEHARHQREVKRHVELVAFTEVRAHELRRLVRLRQQHAIGEVRVESAPQELDDLVRLGQPFAARVLPLDEIRHRIHPEPVDAEPEPELHHVPHLFADGRVVVVQIRLVAEEAMPVIRLRLGIPRPVRALDVDEDDADVAIAIVRIAPDVPIASRVVA